MSLQIDGAEVDLSQLTFSVKWHGKRPLQSRVPFIFTSDISDFLPRLERIYDELIIELRADDNQTGESVEPYPGARDYPSFDQLMQLSSSKRMRIVGTYLKFDVLRLILPEEASRQDSAWIVSAVSDVIDFGNTFTVTGTASLF